AGRADWKRSTQSPSRGSMMMPALPFPFHLSAPRTSSCQAVAFDRIGGELRCQTQHSASSSPPSCVRQAALYIRQPGQEDGLGLVVMIRLENVLAPELRVLSIFEESVQALTPVAGVQERLLEVCRPIGFAG